MKKNVLTVLILLSYWLSSNSISSPDPKQQLLLTLTEAKALLNVLPEKSLSMLANNTLLRTLDLEDQTSWHVTRLNAARQLSNLPVMADSLEQIIDLQSRSANNNISAFVVNQMGVWFRRSGYLNEAKLSYFCTIDNTRNSPDRLRAISNLAVVERNQGHFQHAKSLNDVALQMAQKQKDKIMVALIENNLGILALSHGNAERASQHFRRALDINHQKLRRSSEILNGINLLFSFLELNDYKHYSRFYPRVTRLLQTHPSDARVAYLNWIHQTYLFRQNKHISQQQKNRLIADYKKVNDIGIQVLLSPFAQELSINIALPSSAESKTFEGDWLKRINQCDWDKYQTMSYATLLETIYSSDNS